MVPSSDLDRERSLRFVFLVALAAIFAVTIVLLAWQALLMFTYFAPPLSLAFGAALAGYVSILASVACLAVVWFRRFRSRLTLLPSKSPLGWAFIILGLAFEIVGEAAIRLLISDEDRFVLLPPGGVGLVWQVAYFGLVAVQSLAVPLVVLGAGTLTFRRPRNARVCAPLPDASPRSDGRNP